MNDKEKAIISGITAVITMIKLIVQHRGQVKKEKMYRVFEKMRKIFQQTIKSFEQLNVLKERKITDRVIAKLKLSERDVRRRKRFRKRSRRISGFSMGEIKWNGKKYFKGY